MKFLILIKKSFSKFLKDEPFQKAAAVSYFTLLSLAPLLLVLMAITGLVLSQQSIQMELLRQIEELIGSEGAEIIGVVLKNAARPTQSIISLVIGVFSLFLGATTVFLQLQTALNQIYGMGKKKEGTKGIIGFLQNRIFSFAMILGIGFLLMVSLVFSSVVVGMGDFLKSLMPGMPLLITMIDLLTTLGMITLLIAMMFRFLPARKLHWRDLWFGAFFTAVLFTVGKYFIGLYLGQASIGSTFGAAGSVVVFMVWVYYATIIILFGAEITYVRAFGDEA